MLLSTKDPPQDHSDEYSPRYCDNVSSPPSRSSQDLQKTATMSPPTQYSKKTATMSPSTQESKKTATMSPSTQDSQKTETKSPHTQDSQKTATMSPTTQDSQKTATKSSFMSPPPNPGHHSASSLPCIDVLAARPRMIVQCVLSPQAPEQGVPVQKVDLHYPPPPKAVHEAEEVAHLHLPMHTVQVSPSLSFNDELSLRLRIVKCVLFPKQAAEQADMVQKVDQEALLQPEAGDHQVVEEDELHHHPQTVQVCLSFLVKSVTMNIST